MEFLLTLVPVVIIGVPFFFWITMLVHAMKSHIPHKAIWLLALILGNIIAGIVYYFVVYKDMHLKRTGSDERPVQIMAAIFLLLIAAIGIAATQRQPRLSEVPLSTVIQQADSGEILKIEVRGDELQITKRGHAAPTERSHIAKGSSLYEQGIDKNVPVYYKIQN